MEMEMNLGFKALFLGFPIPISLLPCQVFAFSAVEILSLSVDAGIQRGVRVSLISYCHGRTRSIFVKIKNQEVQEGEQRREAPTNNRTSVTEPPCSRKGEFKVKVQLFQEQPNKIPPLVAYFPSGYNPCKTNPQNQPQEEDEGEGEDGEGSSNQSNPPRVKVFRNVALKKTNRLQVVVSPSGSNVDFVGTSCSGEASAAQVSRYSLGVLDKETGTLKIIPIASNKIFGLDPRVRSSENANKDASDSVKSELTIERKGDKLGELTALYGTKKDRKKRKDFIDLKEEVDPKSQKSLDKMIEQVAFDKEALANTIALFARNIPPHDSSVTTPVEAYPLDKIILKGDWKFLGDIYKLLQVGEGVETNAYPHFVCNRIHKLNAIQDETEEKTLMYLFVHYSSCEVQGYVLNAVACFGEEP